jgi:hypothetical protein
MRKFEWGAATQLFGTFGEPIAGSRTKEVVKLDINKTAFGVVAVIVVFRGFVWLTLVHWVQCGFPSDLMCLSGPPGLAAEIHVTGEQQNR